MAFLETKPAEERNVPVEALCLRSEANAKVARVVHGQTGYVASLTAPHAVPVVAQLIYQFDPFFGTDLFASPFTYGARKTKRSQRDVPARMAIRTLVHVSLAHD